MYYIKIEKRRHPQHLSFTFTLVHVTGWLSYDKIYMAPQVILT